MHSTHYQPFKCIEVEKGTAGVESRAVMLNSSIAESSSLPSNVSWNFCPDHSHNKSPTNGSTINFKTVVQLHRRSFEQAAAVERSSWYQIWTMVFRILMWRLVLQALLSVSSCLIWCTFIAVSPGVCICVTPTVCTEFEKINLAT